ncbi:MAG: exodeoxyribonuclease III [Burkholderiaceae bacterium]
MKIATWNVNSLKVRLPHTLDWLANSRVDILGLQELKLTDDAFPRAALQAIGYDAVFAGQKTYNGVAIVYNKATVPEPTDVQVNLPSYADDSRRVIAASFGALRFVSAYVVNGASLDSDKYVYKLAWLDALLHDSRQWLQDHPALAIVGDFNIAPTDEDVYDPVAWGAQVLCSPAERERYFRLLEQGLHDSFRLFEQQPKTYSWWDYRQLGFQKNKGLRIDHILLSDALKPYCTGCAVDRAPRKKPQPSDHAPVIASLTGYSPLR